MFVITTNCDYKEEKGKISNLQYTESETETEFFMRQHYW